MNLYRYFLATLILVNESFSYANLPSGSNDVDSEPSEMELKRIDQNGAEHFAPLESTLNAKAKKSSKHSSPTETKENHHYVAQLENNQGLRPGQGRSREDIVESHERSLAQNHEFQSRIVGGETAQASDFPFMVNWDRGSCGGSLIGPRTVLTAAHCRAITGGVRIGSNSRTFGGITRSVTNKCQHPAYNSLSNTNDFLILELSESVDTNTYKVIQLNDDAAQPAAGEMLTVIGFGFLSESAAIGSNSLQKVEVPAVSKTQCRQQYFGINEDVQLCAGYQSGGKDSCQGDSGGPIFEFRNGEPVQVGVVSFGDGCARPNRSGVYARVSGGYDWIQSTMASIEAGNGCDGSGTCANEPSGWHDSDGTQYTCDWYSLGTRCAQYGDQFENNGLTANQACCACGGGRDNSATTALPPPIATTTQAPPIATTTQAPPIATTTQAPPVTTEGSTTPIATTQPPPANGNCQDTPGWFDSDGEVFNCAFYAVGTNCADFGAAFENFGQTADEACCACGGGSENSGGAAVQETCQDTPGWFDWWFTGCSWYAQGNRCAQYGNYWSPFSQTAKEACCACGGGSRSNRVAASASEGTCSDAPSGWYDSGGSYFNCEWYGKESGRCARFGDDYVNPENGKTANEACCVCGGGNDN